MTREQATELVNDLLQADRDYEILGRKSYREHLAEVKEKTIAALVGEAQSQKVTKLEAALDQVEEYLDGKVDVVDGDYGVPAPNREMRLMTAIDEARGRGGY